MYSERFQKFIEMWQKDFAIERTIDEKVCVDRDGNPLPWYTCLLYTSDAADD